MPIVLPPYPTPWDPTHITVPKKLNPIPHEPRYYYFAYGSNLWLSQMHHRCPQFTCVGVGVLRGYRWLISGRGYANVVPSENKGKEAEAEEGDTYGVVYTLTRSDMDTLDMYEGTDMKPVPAYYKVNMGIEMVKNSDQGDKDFQPEINCLVYVDPRTEEGVVHKEYIGRINRGLRDVDFPRKWVKRVMRKWIPAGVGVPGGDVDEDGEESEEIEKRDMGERKGVKNGVKRAVVRRGEEDEQVVHWVPTGV